MKAFHSWLLFVLLFTFSYSTSNITFAAEVTKAREGTKATEAGKVFRSLVHDLVFAADEGVTKEERAERFLKIFQEPKYFDLLLRGENFADLWRQADLPPVYQELGAGPVKAMFGLAQTLEPFQPFIRNLNPLSGNYDGHLSSVRNGLSSDLSFLATLATRVVPSVLPESVKQASIDLISEKVFKSIRQMIMDFKISESVALETLLNPALGGIDMSMMPPKFQSLFQNTILKYFDKIPYEQKRKVMLGFLSTHPGASPAEQLAKMVVRTGMLMIKIMQTLVNEIKSPAIRDALSIVKDNIPHDEIELIKEKFMKAMREAGGTGEIDQYVKEIGAKPLGTGSVAQVHLAELLDDVGGQAGTKAAFKFRKAGVDQQFLVEVATMQNAVKGENGEAGDKYTQELLELIIGEMKKDVSLNIEFESLVRLQPIYNRPDLGIQIVKPLLNSASGKELFPHNDEFYAMTLAPGKSLDKWTEKDMTERGRTYLSFIQAKQEKIISLLKIWGENALFGTGDILADPHAGNMTMNIDNPFAASNEKLKTTLHLYDAGTTAVISSEQQHAIVRLGVGIIMGLPDEVMGGIKDMLGEKVIAGGLDQQLKFNRMEFLVRKLLRKESSPFKVMEKVFQIGTTMELTFPAALMNFNRARILLEQHLDEINRELNIYDPKATVARITAEEVYYLLIVENAIRYNFRTALASLPIPYNPFKASPNSNPLGLSKIANYGGAFLKSFGNGGQGCDQNKTLSTLSDGVTQKLAFPLHHSMRYLRILWKFYSPDTAGTLESLLVSFQNHPQRAALTTLAMLWAYKHQEGLKRAMTTNFARL
jgi:predicted unusual protein kinase regulating ubiquinone biosynthesis (AarF/ABC1/UbiB family)